jgi:hypothetical protein
VSFAALGRKSVLQEVKEIFADQPGRPKPVVDQAPPKAVLAASATATTPPAPSTGTLVRQPAAGAPQADGFEQAAAGLIETGVRFLESVAAVMRSAPAGEGPDGGIDRKLASLVSRDPNTGRPLLSIPLPPTVDESRIARAIAGLLSAFQR